MLHEHKHTDMVCYIIGHNQYTAELLETDLSEGRWWRMGELAIYWRRGGENEEKRGRWAEGDGEGRERRERRVLVSLSLSRMKTNK